MASIVRRKEPTGWAIFAAVVLLLVGLFNVIYGLTALLHNQVLTVSPSGDLIVWDLRSWGWITLIIGAILIAAGIGLLRVQNWARWLAIGVAVLNAMAWISLINLYPFWAIVIISLDVLVIYNLSARWQPEVR